MKKKVRVGFTKLQYDIVNDFLNKLRESGVVERDLGAPVKVNVEWGGNNTITLQGPNGHKLIPIKDVLEQAARSITTPRIGPLVAVEGAHE